MAQNAQEEEVAEAQRTSERSRRRFCPKADAEEGEQQTAGGLSLPRISECACSECEGSEIEANLMVAVQKG